MDSKVREAKSEFWLTPPEIYKALDDEFHFNFDPCPYPWNGVDGTEIEWGDTTYLNPPFRKSDGKNGKGPTAFIRKAIEENKKGKTVVIMINTNSFINMLIEAGAEMRSFKRVKWLDGRTKQPWKSPSNTTCFILRGDKHKNPALTTAQGELAELRKEVYDLKEILKLFVDSEPCRYEGSMCRTHGLSIPCPHKLATAALTKSNQEKV